MNCRFCSAVVTNSFANLGMSPLSNSFVPLSERHKAEKFYPLHAYVCEQCYLVQLEEFESPESIFGDYVYFSSFSSSWLKHAETFSKRMIDRFALGGNSKVFEVASNDGYLLQYFKASGVPVLGIEPARNVAEVALAKDINTICEFLGESTANAIVSQHGCADLVVANNVLAHVPDINDFVRGLKILLSPEGTISVEYPSLLNLLKYSQFDTIYHEHFSYLSLSTVESIFRFHGLEIYDVERLDTHGGSLRIFACHLGDSPATRSSGYEEAIQEELDYGLRDLEVYKTFQNKIHAAKNAFLTFLIEAKQQGKTIAAYGAPAKGNTLLNYCGVGVDFIDYTVDLNPAKQSTLLPGTRIPVHEPEKLQQSRPDYVLVLPWNILDEVMEQLEFVRQWGGKFVRAIPELEII